MLQTLKTVVLKIAVLEVLKIIQIQEHLIPKTALATQLEIATNSSYIKSPSIN